MVSGQSTVTSSYATNPMKLLAPRTRGKSVWACTSSFGGGLVAGDQTRMEIRVDAGARCYLGTQASTKVYRNRYLRSCGHTTRATVGAGSLLVFAPDPVQAFADSTYTQCQEFRLAADASLVLVDWFTSGRAARGERWAFSRFASRNEVWCQHDSTHDDDSELIFVDSLRLDAAESRLDSPHQTGRFNCFATLLLFGPALRDLAKALLADIAARPVERRSPFVCGASPLRGGALLRAAGEQVEAVAGELHRQLAPITCLLGDDPWARKW